MLSPFSAFFTMSAVISFIILIIFLKIMVLNTFPLLSIVASAGCVLSAGMNPRIFSIFRITINFFTHSVRTQDEKINL